MGKISSRSLWERAGERAFLLVSALILTFSLREKGLFRDALTALARVRSDTGKPRVLANAATDSLIVASCQKQLFATITLS